MCSREGQTPDPGSSTGHRRFHGGAYRGLPAFANFFGRGTDCWRMIKGWSPRSRCLMLTILPIDTHHFHMKATVNRIALLAGCLSVAFVVLLAATASPASAHPHGMHGAAAMAGPHSSGGDSYAAETCCHKTGTCVVQFLQRAPTTAPLDGSLTQLECDFAVACYASISSATDPPPPRA